MKITELLKTDLKVINTGLLSFESVDVTSFDAEVLQRVHRTMVMARLLDKKMLRLKVK